MNAILLNMVYAAVISGIITALITPFVKTMALRFQAVREVRARDSHESEMPLWGGLAMFIGFAAVVLLMRPLLTHHEYALSVGKGEHPIAGIMIGAAIVAIIGLLDDKIDLKPWQQMGGLLLAGFVAASLGARIDGITNPFAPPSPSGAYDARNYIDLGVFAVPLTMLWYFIATKTFDFLDGLDGLASGVCAIAATTMGLIAAAKGDEGVALMAFALAGACIGFLRHNFNPATIFMGSVGSFFLGFVLAGLAVIGTAKIPTILAVVVPGLVLGVPILDGFRVAAVRVLRGKNPLAADKTHIHHLLREWGLSVKQAVWVIYGLTAAGCIAALLLVYTLTRTGP